MARNFDGTNDKLLSADNACPGLDTTTTSFAAWVLADEPAAQQQLFLAAQTGTSQLRKGCTLIVPLSAGYRLQTNFLWSTTGGNWNTSADITAGVRHHLAVTYDGGSTTNDPVMYVDGVSVAVTEAVAPTGTFGTGADTFRVGESVGSALDLAGTLSHIAWEAGAIWDAAAVNRAMWWGRPHGGMNLYHPLLTDKLADEGSEGETLTATGTTVVSFVTPCVRPGSMVGMGW